MKIEIPEKLLPIFTTDKRFIVLHGGRDSSKSHSIARFLIVKALEKKRLILCCREIQKSIATSSYALLVNIIREYGFDQYFDIVESEIRCTKTGSKFIFQGLRSNIESIKSTEGIDIAFVEEASTVSHESWRILIPTIRKENSQILISFNPNKLSDPVYQMFITNEHPDALVIPINYNENPFLSETSKKEIERMKASDADLFDWIYNGKIRAITEATVLTNILIHKFDINMTRQMYYGADWGMNDPTVLIQSYIDDDELYICREFYKTGLDPEQLKREFLNLEWALNQHIVADSARPEFIKMFNATGRFQMTGARKNIGQPVKEGMFKFSMAMYLKHFSKIHIHTSCTNSAREFTSWQYDTDKNENILDIIRDKDDHCPDALIYSLERPANSWYRTHILRGDKTK